MEVDEGNQVSDRESAEAYGWKCNYIEFVNRCKCHRPTLGPVAWSQTSMEARSANSPRTQIS